MQLIEYVERDEGQGKRKTKRIVLCVFKITFVQINIFYEYTKSKKDTHFF